MKGKWMAAVMACGEGAALSHRDAATVWEIRWASGAKIDVSIRTRSRRARPGIAVHRPRALLDRDVSRIDGIPVTSLARTLLDLGQVVTLRHLERACDEAELLEIFDLRAVLDVLDRAGGHRGAAKLRKVIRHHKIGSTLTRLELEERFLALCRRNGIPLPRVNAWIAFEDGGGAEVDFYWPRERLVVETDGVKVHGRHRTMISDRQKELRLDALDITVKRYLWNQVAHEEAAVAGAILRAISARGAKN
jgi:uncharacterized protein DUF559